MFTTLDFLSLLTGNVVVNRSTALVNMNKSGSCGTDSSEGVSYFTTCFAGSAVLLLFTYAVTWLRWRVHAQSRPQNYSNIILWKALVLSNCGKFLMIPSLIWGEIGTETHSLFIMGYTFLSQLKIYSGECICPCTLDT